MKDLQVILALVATCSCIEVAAAQETLPPIPIGPHRVARWEHGGQLGEITTETVSALVYFETISLRQVAGFVVRTSGGTTQGTVTIRWENRGSEVAVHVDAGQPQASFDLRGPLPLRSPRPQEHD